MHERLEIVSFAISLFAYVPLWWIIWKKGWRPKKATFIVFTAVNIVIFGATCAQKDPEYQILAYTLGSLSLAVFGIFWGEAGWTRTDKRVLAASGVALLIAPFSLNATIALAVLAVIIGSWAMWEKMWHTPEDEPWQCWLMFWCGGLCGVFAVSKWSFASGIAPIGFFLQQTITILLSIHYRPWRTKR